MKTTRILIIISILASTLQFGKLFSQVLEAPAPVVNRAWEKTEIDPKRGHNANRKPIPYTYLREADVMWAHRTWRVIDLREKMNYPLYYPQQAVSDRVSFMETLWKAVTKEGILPSYNDEDFTMPLIPTQVVAKFSKSSIVTGKSIINTDIDSTYTVDEVFKPEDVKKIVIKEDWFFDRQRSVMDVRIISICPVMDEYTVDPVSGEKSYKGMKPVFFLYFPHVRPLLARNEVFNTHNDAERRTYDDIFMKRFFGSYITKEENVYDRRIDEYTKGLDALLEAERIKQDIFIIEHDLWEY